MPVNTTHHEYEKTEEKWKRLRDCDGGRDAILKAGNKYVPDLPGLESGTDIILKGPNSPNQAYRARGNFYNAVSKTVQAMSGSIFQTAPEVDIVPTFEDYLEDITLTGVPFEMFASDAGHELMLVGRFGILVDYAIGPQRPFFTGYKAEQITNWKTSRLDGDQVLTMLVLKEETEDTEANDKDEFECKTLVQYRVLKLVNNAVTVQLWRETKTDAKQFEKSGEEETLLRRGVPLDFIPFVFLGCIHITPEVEDPMLIDLADVNLGHWRNSVDYEHGLHLVALPTPYRSGAKDAGGSGPVRIGPQTIWELELQGTAGMVEFTGTGLKAIFDAMEEKKKQMATLGAKVLEDAPQHSETASAVRLRHSGEHGSLRTLAQAIEQGFSSALQMVAWWAGTNADLSEDDASVELNKDYLNVKASPQEVQAALQALQAGEISFETWYAFLQSGGWAREGIDAAAERKAILEAKALEPEPVVDPELMPNDGTKPPAPAPSKKTITGPDGKVKYTIEG